MSAGAQAEARYEVSFSQEGKTKRMILPPSRRPTIRLAAGSGSPSSSHSIPSIQSRGSSGTGSEGRTATWC